MGNDIEYPDGNIGDTQRILNYLYFLHWKQNYRYLCLRLETEQRDISMLSAAATLGHIETPIPSGHAFAVVVNLSYAHSSASEVINRLAVLMREGLLKMGSSSEIHDFMLVPQGYIQASAALDLGRKSESMTWCYRFGDYLLEYLLQHRSTLFYRLGRIRKIAGIDFEDSRERLILKLSFYILEQKLGT